VPSEFIARVSALAHAAGTMSWDATALGLAALAGKILLRRFAARVPAAIVALVIGTLAALLLRLPVDTIGARFGGITSGLPHFKLPQFHPEMIPILLRPALTVALLGAIE